VMRNIFNAIMFILVAQLSLPVLAVVETYEFNSEDLRGRYNDLLFELRCPKCQNQNLADSDAPIAADLRAQVYRLLNENNTDAEVKAYLVARYGDFVLYNPPVNKHTAMLWLLPAGGLLIGIIVIFMLVRRTSTTDQTVALNQSQQQRLTDILNDQEPPN
jgi:cytochrome c-type biogenesis protein CcmH